MAMKPRAMGKKKMMRGGAVKQPVAKRVQSAGFTPLPVGLPKRSRKSNTQAFNDRTELNKKAQTARAAGPAVNAATAKKRAVAENTLMAKRTKAAAALKSKRTKARDALILKRAKALKPIAKKPIAKKPSKPAPTRSGPIGIRKIGDEPRLYSKAIASAIKGSLGAASGSAKMMRGGMKKPVAKMRGGGLKKK
jgi:hypothetical protein